MFLIKYVNKMFLIKYVNKMFLIIYEKIFNFEREILFE